MILKEESKYWKNHNKEVNEMVKTFRKAIKQLNPMKWYLYGWIHYIWFQHKMMKQLHKMIQEKLELN